MPTSHAHLGMAASIADGVRALADWDYLFLGLGDMPYVQRRDARSAQSGNGRARASIADRASSCRCSGDAPGHPVGFSREFFAELIALTGDRGARSVIDAHPDAVVASMSTTPV